MRYLGLALLAAGFSACGTRGEGAMVTASDVDAAPRGRVATLSGESATIDEVTLTPFEGQPFANHLVHLRQLPANVTPDADGCYCFPETDDRFALPHAYEHATRAISAYNTRLGELGLPPVQGVGLEIRKAAAGVLTTGSTQDQPEHWSFVETSSPIVDTSVLVHELGHVFDAYVRGQGGADAPSSVRVPLALNEVFANLFSVLYLNVSTFAAYAWKDAALDMTIALHSPDRLISERAFFQRAIDAPRFSAAFPATVKLFNDALASPNSERYDDPDSYSSSAIVIGPMLELARTCGGDEAQRVALAALHDIGPEAGVAEYASRLVAQAGARCPGAAPPLEVAYHDAGIL
jgi:hypothetical protein